MKEEVWRCFRFRKYIYQKKERKKKHEESNILCAVNRLTARLLAFGEYRHTLDSWWFTFSLVFLSSCIVYSDYSRIQNHRHHHDDLEMTMLMMLSLLHHLLYSLFLTLLFKWQYILSLHSSYDGMILFPKLPFFLGSGCSWFLWNPWPESRIQRKTWHPDRNNRKMRRRIPSHAWLSRYTAM